MSRPIVFQFEHYRGDDRSILWGFRPGSKTDDLVVADSEEDARSIWRRETEGQDLYIGRITRITPLFKDEVDDLISRAKWLGIQNNDMLEILRSINSRLS